MNRMTAALCVFVLALMLREIAAAQPQAGPPLGSKENPIRCDDPDGERWYLSRLRDREGQPISAIRLGSTSRSRFGGIMDIYLIKTKDGTEGKVYMDMYHKMYVCNEPLPGLRILMEQDPRFEYIDGKIHKLGESAPYTGDIETAEDEFWEGAKSHVEHGLIVGRQTYFYPSGKRKVEYPYENGRKHGSVTWYREDGSLWSELPFVDGKLEGTQILYDETGNKKMEIPYIDHREHGTLISYYPNGQVQWTSEYRQGERHGWTIEYDEDGVETRRTEYDDGAEKK